eukprot:3979450-Alexandrium_andersonii.AAC.1
MCIRDRQKEVNGKRGCAALRSRRPGAIRHLATGRDGLQPAARLLDPDDRPRSSSLVVLGRGPGPIEGDDN